MEKVEKPFYSKDEFTFKMTYKFFFFFNVKFNDQQEKDLKKKKY